VREEVAVGGGSVGKTRVEVIVLVAVQVDVAEGGSSVAVRVNVCEGGSIVKVGVRVNVGGGGVVGRAVYVDVEVLVAVLVIVLVSV
jgi:hypothetical protein